mmetsp:Transcript_15722/g.39132  ORF Transcript_15722/g.39132 Transcript_15722/m.39132 type:complete len:365 (-) Transcript_15722:61-1155(-)
MKNICLIGPPGSGKGSYGKLISKALGVPLISTSDILKRHGLIFSSSSSEEDNNGGSGSSIISGSSGDTPQQRPRDDGNCHSLSGKLIDDSVVCETLLKEFQHMEEEEKKMELKQKNQNQNRNQHDHHRHNNSGYVLDGFPRTLRQINIMTATWPHHLRVDGAIKLAVPDVVCQQKLEGRRLCLKCGGNYNVADVQYYDNDDDDDDDNGDGDNDVADEEKHQQNGSGDDGGSGRWWNLPAYLPETEATETVDTSKGAILPPSGSKFVCGCDPTVDWMTRHDDEHGVVLNRLKVYHEHMDPILDYFDSSREVEEGSVDYNSNTTSQRQSQSHCRLLKLYPYNGFDDVPQIIETVQSWIGDGSGMDR